MTLPEADLFIAFRDDLQRQEMLFQRPQRLIIAEEPHQFEAAFQALEQARNDGKWLAGFISYEAGFLLEPQLNHLLPQNRQVPLICFGVFDAPLNSELNVPDQPDRDVSDYLHNFRPKWSKQDYATRFDRLHQHLREGDCYQGNLTFPIKADFRGDPVALFEALAQRQPVRYSAIVHLQADAHSPLILSRSPELFFEVDQQGWIETHPMKGTTPRGTTPEQDDAYRDFLLDDEKSQAENRMIVDLLRNDISLISEVGSLDVPKLFDVERYPTVHQMVSHVRAKLLPDLSIRQIFAALFPCGSITGAPKISAMTILNQLEACPRDIYCGSIGWIAPKNHTLSDDQTTIEMRFNVAIRTISLFDNKRAVLNVGGGVVYDSTAEDEYAECLLKARYATGSSDISIKVPCA